MAVPVVFLGCLGLAFATLWGVTRFGNPTSTGESVTIEFSAACLDEAMPMIAERAKQVGMPVELKGGVMHTTLPELPNAKATIPQLLTTPGQFALKGENFHAGNDDIEEVAIDLDRAGMPQTLIKFNSGTRAAIKELDDTVPLLPTLDAVEMPSVTAVKVKEDGVLSIHSGEGKTADRMQRAADRAIVLAHGPLPCSVQVQNIRSAGDANN